MSMLMKYLVICPLVGLAGFVDAIAGGGGLISLPAYLFTGMPVLTAVATNKMSSSMGATITLGKYAKSGFIPWKTAIPCIGLAVAGSSLGAKIAMMISDYWFKRLILVILPLTAIYIYRNKAMVTPREPLGFWATTVISCLCAFFIGIYDGFYGPGTGVFLILFLTALAHLGLREANGLCKAINWTSNVSALVLYLINGQVLVGVGITAGIFNVVGNYLGARTFEKRGAQSVKPLMLLVVGIFFIKLLLEIMG